MKLLCGYYRLNKYGSCARTRSEEHLIRAGKPLCGKRIDEERYVWKTINGPSTWHLCYDCQQRVSEQEALRAWNAGEPIR